MNDTIFALSTGAPPAAIAVIRISGPLACKALECVAGTLPPPQRLSLKNLRDPENGDLLDRALVTHFPAETSVTGEPLAELHVHGGRAVVDAVLQTLERLPGLSPAKAGQFTWRSFDNGRVDLVEVESLSHLLRAETDAQRRAALAGDGLSSRIEDWRKRVLTLSAYVEAALDQSDEDDVPADRTIPLAIATELIDEVDAILAEPTSERLFDGVRVVFAGPPNTGKSTLVNAIAGREVAIVSPIAGTTRDVLEAPVAIDGIAFVLTDTAGLRSNSTDPIELEGIARAHARIKDADLIVWMDDASPPPEIAQGRLIPIVARADLPRHRPVSDRLPVSVRTGEGMRALKKILATNARALLPKEGGVALLRRQSDHLGQFVHELQLSLLSSDDLIAAEHLRRSRLSLDRLTGRAGTEEMLDSLFSTFCIGK